jgi:cell division protein FtsB
LLVNNDPILWTMLNAIKEQQAQIEALRQANNALHERLRNLEQRRRKRVALKRTP